MKYLLKMKYFIGLLLLALLAFSACKGDENEKNIPDVSKIAVEIKLERFDQDIFALDTNRLDEGMAQLGQKYPMMFQLFTENIISKLLINNSIIIIWLGIILLLEKRFKRLKA